MNYREGVGQSECARFNRWLLLSAAMGAMLVVPGMAFAQEAGVEPAEVASAASSIGEIIVTANRREERAQDVPIAITALSSERLQQQGIAKAQDLAASIPSLVVGPNGQGSRESQSFTLRGQGATFQASPGVVTYMMKCRCHRLSASASKVARDRSLISKTCRFWLDRRGRCSAGTQRAGRC